MKSYYDALAADDKVAWAINKLQHAAEKSQKACDIYSLLPTVDIGRQRTLALREANDRAEALWNTIAATRGNLGALTKALSTEFVDEPEVVAGRDSVECVIAIVRRLLSEPRVTKERWPLGMAEKHCKCGHSIMEHHNKTGCPCAQEGCDCEKLRWCDCRGCRLLYRHLKTTS